MINIEEIVLKLTYTTYAVNLLTIIGSLLSFIIFSRKAFKKSAIGIYCRSLAIFDLFVCANFIAGIASILMKDSSLIQDTEWLCKMSTYITSAFSAMSGWVLVFFSLDQLITVLMSNRFPIFKKKWFQYSLILGLFVFHCLIYSPYIFLSELRNTTSSGNVTACKITSIALPLVLLFESSILPLAILFILTALIIRYLNKSRANAFNEHIMSSVNSQRRVLHEYKYAFNSVILNIFHIVFSSPLIISLTIPFNDIELFMLVGFVGYLFYSLNFALHFWVHFCVNSIFRNEFFILIRVKNNVN